MKRARRSIGRAALEQGFTLPELALVVVIVGILMAIGLPSWYAVLENRQVEAAANQVAADLRLANSSATNRLGTASLSFDDVTADGLTVTCNGTAGADYCLLKPDGATFIAKAGYLPDNTKIASLNMVSPGNAAANITGKVQSAERTIYFDNSGLSRPGGSALAPIAPGACPSSTPTSVLTIIVAAEDNSPRRCVRINPTTSRVQID